MILYIAFLFFIAVATMIFKKSVWVASPLATEINYRSSYFFWFTSADFSNPKYKEHKWILMFNNTTNIIVAICCLALLVFLTIIFLGLLG